MANYKSLKTTINANVKRNGNQEITGQILNSVLNAMVETLGTGYSFAGVATPSTNPGTPDAKVFYIVNGKGTYTLFGDLEVTEDDVVILYYDTDWHKVSTGIAREENLTNLGKEIATKQNTLTDTDGGYGQRVANLEKEGIASHEKLTELEMDSSLEGNGATGVEKYLYTLLAGKRYRLTFANNNWNKTGTGEDVTVSLFQLSYYVGGVKSNIINVSLNQEVSKSYEFNMVDNDYVRIFIRASKGERVVFKIEEVANSEYLSSYDVFYTKGKINCNNTERRFELESNLTFTHEGNRIVVQKGTTIPYDWDTQNSSLVFLAYNVSTSSFFVDYYYNLKKGEHKVIAALYVGGTSANTLEVRKIIHSMVDFSIDGVNAESRIEKSETDIDIIKNSLSASNTVINKRLVLDSISKGSIYNGVNSSSSNAFRTNSYYPIIPNTNITFSFNARQDGNSWYYRVVEYDVNKVFLRQNETFKNNETHKVGDDTRYVRFVFRLTNSGGSGVAFDSLSDTYTNEEVVINYIFLDLAAKKELDDLSAKIDAISPVSEADMTGIYQGEKISLVNRYKIVNPALVSSIEYHQSIAVYGKYAVTSMYSGTGTASQGATCFGQIIDIETNEKTSINFPIGTYNRPHCNTMVFGNEFAPGNDVLPLLYISMWDYSNERGCLVYDVRKVANGWSATLVQAIIPNVGSIGTEIIGNGSTDWVVDTDNNCIYSLAYYLAGSSTIEVGNKQMIVKYALPRLSDGEVINLSLADVLDHYETECFNYGQDKAYLNGKIYVIAGGGSEYSYMNKLRVLDLVQKQIVSRVNLNINQEPEGLTIYQNRLLFDYGFNPFEMVF